MTSSGDARLVVGYGQDWERHKARTRRLLALGLAANLVTAVAAVLAWASVVTRELPVVTLAAGDAMACEGWRPQPSLPEWSPVQVRWWVRSLIDAALVQDSQRVKENLQRVTTMLSAPLRVELRNNEAMRQRFAQAAKLKVTGTVSELTIDCGDQQRFVEGTAPWRCIAYGAIAYAPAYGPVPESMSAVTNHFFVEVALQPGQIAPANPLGFEAVEFWPREAATAEVLERMVAEEQL